MIIIFICGLIETETEKYRSSKTEEKKTYMEMVYIEKPVGGLCPDIITSEWILPPMMR